MTDTNQHVTPSICPALLRLAQANGVVTFNCQLDDGHTGKHFVKYTETYRQELVPDAQHTTPSVSERVEISTEIYWVGDSRQEDWEEIRNILSAWMKNPPSIEQIATWTPAMVAEARGWALWQTYMGVGTQAYPKPKWLGE